MNTTVSFATGIITALPYFLGLEIDYLFRSNKKQFLHEAKRRSSKYDFIVVGGGVAGSVMAGQLSEKFNVLLLEAGGEPPSISQVPAFFEDVWNAPKINFRYTSVPQDRANHRRIVERQGSLLGGSGSTGGLIYNRGHPKDFDNWARISKDNDWKYNSLLKFFKAIETYHGIWPVGSQHGTKGPIGIVTSERPIHSVWKKAGLELGYATVDPNGPQREGFSPSELTRQNGRRVSTYNAYVQPNTGRETLTVTKYAFVHKVLFSKTNRAKGVEYIRHGVKFRAFASNEVIISAGAYGSPLVLFKSGIGPKDLLAAANIKERADLPVGANLQNHPGVVFGPIMITDPSKLSNANNNLTETDFKAYLAKKPETVLSEPGLGPQALLVSPLAKQRGEFDWPDFQIVNVATSFAASDSSEPIPPNRFSLIVYVGRPEFDSRTVGSVTLNTTAFRSGSIDNAELAEIDFRFLHSQRDFEVLKYALSTALKVVNTEAFQEIGATYIKDPECGKDHHVGGDPYWRCYVKKNGHMFYHPAGTCRMGGGKLDPTSVVDSKLRVHGVQRLRIVDASVMPQVTNSNTNAPVIVIAYKALSDILQIF